MRERERVRVSKWESDKSDKMQPRLAWTHDSRNNKRVN
jgi:hypothetical protein